MIAFASLFLGLFLGVKPVEMVVGEGVAAVELRLDGQRLGKMDASPWIRDVDFGSELAPRHLEAVALDAGGRELSRVSQWLNLPQEAAVVTVVLEPAQPGRPRLARLSWESMAGAEPEAVTATLDGAPVAVSDPHRIELPAVDESQLHLLHVELEFEDHVTSSVDLTFGGAYADEVSTEITALAIRATRKLRRPPTPESAAEWFLKDGEPLPVITIEKGTAEVVVVRDRAFPRFVAPSEPYKPPRSLYLAGDQHLRFLSTIPSQTEGVAATFNLFPVSPPYDGGLGDVYRLLTGVSFRASDDPPHLNSAVSVAGLAAYRGRHRRAVVIIPSSRPDADAALSPAQVRRYLGRLAVPLLVWDPEAKSAPHVAAWGEVRRVGSLEKLAAAFAELSDLLDQQWIVWLDGRHLPQDIELAPQVKDFALLR